MPYLDGTDTKREFTRLPTDAEVKRFYSYIDTSGGPDACWPWLGCLDHGYGVFSWDSWHPKAHRFMWFLRYGTPKPNLTIDHECHTTECKLTSDCPHRRCQNPRHLYQKSNGENGNRTGNAAKTHCKYGHFFSQENTYFKKDGARGCRRCAKERDQARYEKRWAKEKALQTNTSEREPKLNAEQVKEIRALYAMGGWSQRQLARFFKVSQPAIGFIIRRETWKNV